MALDLFSPSSSTTKKRICKDQQLGEYDEDGVNLSLSLAPLCSLDLKLSLLPTPVQSKKCHYCQCTETPLWRTGPRGMRTLCNACGLRYRRLDHRRKACLVKGIQMWYSKAIDREFAGFVGKNWKEN